MMQFWNGASSNDDPAAINSGSAVIPAQAGIHSKGFTLIEILIVVLIISIVTSVGVLTISHNNNKEIEFFAKEFSQVIRMAEEQALLQPVELGLIISPDNYQFVARNDASNPNKKKWSALDDNVLGKHAIPEQIAIRVDTHRSLNAEDDQAASPQPQFIISTNGDVTPFTIYIGKKGAKPRFTITGDADGTITTKELE